METGGWKNEKGTSYESSYPTYEEWKHQYVPIISFLVPRQFLSYLWGMETCQYWNIAFIEKLFLSYLWGMETC